MLTARIIPEIVAQHAEDASFLWGLRENAVDQPHYSLADLARLDLRVDAHLDGLRVAALHDWEAVAAFLQYESKGDLFVATSTGFALHQKDVISKVLSAVRPEPMFRHAVASALEWLPPQVAAGHSCELVGADPVSTAIAVEAATARRQPPERQLASLFEQSDEELRAGALRAAGEFGQRELIEHVARHLRDDSDLCRFWAAWSLSLLGEDATTDLLASAVRLGPNYLGRGLAVALRCMPLRTAKQWVAESCTKAELTRLSIIAMGILGNPEFIDFLLAHISLPPYSRIAGESITFITGVNFRERPFESGAPPGFELVPSGSLDDPAVDMDPDEHLPWPNASAIVNWWMENRAEFTPGARYLLGKPISTDWCQFVLRNGRQRHRAAAALEAAILQPGQPVFNVAAPGFRQQQMLGLKR